MAADSRSAVQRWSQCKIKPRAEPASSTTLLPAANEELPLRWAAVGRGGGGGLPAHGTLAGDSSLRLFGRGCRVKIAAGLVMVFLFLLQQAAAQGSPSRVAGIVGGTAYLHPAPRNRTTFHQVHWRYETSQKIAIREADGSIRYPDSRFKDRLRLFPNNTLQIRSLRKSDRGVYWLYLEEETGTEHRDSVHLVVYERVPKPTVRAEVEGGDAAHCRATLTCSVDLEEVTYEWILTQRQPPESRGSELHLSFRPGVETYVCRVSNAVSASNASLTYRHPCSWQAESSAVSMAQNTKMLLALAFLFFLLLLA